MEALLRIGAEDTAIMPAMIPAAESADVPLADYEAEMLLKAGRGR